MAVVQIQQSCIAVQLWAGGEEAFYIRNKALEYGLIFAVSGYYYNRITLIPAITIRKNTVEKALKIFDKLFNEAKDKF